jgi:hypothetical protein
VTFHHSSIASKPHGPKDIHKQDTITRTVETRKVHLKIKHAESDRIDTKFLLPTRVRRIRTAYVAGSRSLGFLNNVLPTQSTAHYRLHITAIVSLHLSILNILTSCKWHTVTLEYTYK